MNIKILQPEIQHFIATSEGADTYRLLLQKSPFEGVNMRELVEQIEARTRIKLKLPGWYAAPAIYYPNKKYLEQSSSERTAAYKASVVTAQTVVDLTGGFGVDSLYFAKRSGKVVYFEKNKSLAAIAEHNFRQFGVSNIQTIVCDGIQWLERNPIKADLIYIDPSRRSGINQRVFLLSECEPDVTAHLDLLFKVAPVLLIKTAPLLDLSAGLRAMNQVKEIHVVAVNNEVKEVLWLLQRGIAGPVVVRAINMTKGEDELFSFEYDSERLQAVSYSQPLSYLFEPNAAIMKSGGFKTLSRLYGIAKLDEHSHLYTSDKALTFPGRSFKIIRMLPYTKKNTLSLGIKKANVSTRNFPVSVQEIRNKYGITDGGNTYLFFTTVADQGLTVIECEKI